MLLTLLLLLLPVFAAAAPTLDLTPSPSSIEAVTPAIALENQFRTIHDTHHAAKKEQIMVVTTRNELVSGKCAPIIVIFARGTGEPGNVGDDVGPEFFKELEKLKSGKTIVQGVNKYPANILRTVGYLNGGSDSGAKDMAASVNLVSTQCPKSKIVLSGFSQGAQVTHKAAKMLATEMYRFVGAIVVFGYPYNGTKFPGTLNDNVKSFCHDGDLICHGLPFPGKDHSNYENDAPEAAAYVAARL
ncbi:cutinase-domain-containing protein [Wilcoxina mikolae CBS 423.85]|nr:cutinase-domain-containing protein [Wilcoxina mikolae CBS 423.85]